MTTLAPRLIGLVVALAGGLAAAQDGLGGRPGNPAPGGVLATPIGQLNSVQFRDWVFYHNAGWTALRNDKLDRAAFAFGQAIEIARLEVEADPRLAARSYADLAWTLHRQGRDADAEPLVRWALTVREKAFGPASAQAAETVYTLASIDVRLGKLDEAETLLTRVLESIEKSKGPNSPEAADALLDLATVHVLRRRFDRARPLYARAASLYQNIAFAPIGQAGAFDGLAAIDLFEGKFADAEPRLARALELIDADPSAPADLLTRILTHQAELFRATKRPDDAAKAEARARGLGIATPGLSDSSKNAPTNAMPTPATGMNRPR